jgi:hypothetical protein
MFRFHITVMLACVLTIPVFAEEEALSYADSIKSVDPMDLTGVEPGLANVLRRYYEFTFQDYLVWGDIESIRFDGILETPNGAVRFSAFKKKPDYTKVVLYLGREAKYVMAFDGRDAWQFNTGLPDAAPVDMPEDEARGFIRDATTGGHLLYPRMEGKRIELLEERAEFDGKRYYQLETTLPDGQRIRHFINAINFAEERQVSINPVSGAEETHVYRDFRKIQGIRIPFETTVFVEGEKSHTTRFERVRVNVGAMPWMFARPSGAYLPGDFEETPPLSAADVDTLLEAGAERRAAVDAALDSRIGSSAFDDAPSGFEVDPELLKPAELPIP